MFPRVSQGALYKHGYSPPWCLSCLARPILPGLSALSIFLNFQATDFWGLGREVVVLKWHGVPSGILSDGSQSNATPHRTQVHRWTVTAHAHGSSSESTVPERVAVAPPGDFWEMQPLRPHPRSPDSVTLESKPNNVCRNEKWVVFMKVKLKNHWYRAMDMIQTNAIILAFAPFPQCNMSEKRTPVMSPIHVYSPFAMTVQLFFQEMVYLSSPQVWPGFTTCSANRMKQKWCMNFRV